MMAFELQVQLGSDWVTLVGYEGGCLALAEAACRQAVMSEKAHARIRGCEEGEIVYERFYNSQDDPDVNWRDESYDDEMVDVDWKKEGF